MVAVEIDVAGRNQKIAVNEIDDAVSEVRREEGAVVFRFVFLQAPGDVNARIALAHGELDVRISFVVAQEDVVARLLLLDEVVLERQRLFFVADDDVFNIDSLTEEAAGFGILVGSSDEVRTYPRAEVLGLSHVDNLAFGVLVEVHAGGGGKGADFLVQIHGSCVWLVEFPRSRRKVEISLVKILRRPPEFLDPAKV